MDPADLAVPEQPAFVCLATIGRVGPDIGGRIVVRHHVPEHTSIEANPIGDLALADEPEPATNRNAALLAKARDRNVRLRFAIPCRSGLGELQRPACIRVLLRRVVRFVRPDLVGALAFFDRLLLALIVALLERSNERSIDDLAAHREIASPLQHPVECS